ncbi:hypothetical protein AAFF_G00105990 [Aldrovandia affinis]|uniref:Uncharacterized protein n=1 Tax=Aldrovandia affinis TaxID=143900 RepID=A0AAD7T3B4_9TELE|nr:hypothetical protein AAFF_G00105990 [Aldrovandia affinis]
MYTGGIKAQLSPGHSRPLAQVRHFEDQTAVSGRAGLDGVAGAGRSQGTHREERGNPGGIRGVLGRRCSSSWPAKGARCADQRAGRECVLTRCHGNPCVRKVRRPICRPLGRDLGLL